MNLQAMMKQAQKLQGDMTREKNEIDNTVFEHTKSFIDVKATGDKKITSLKINMDDITKDDLEMIEDMILVTVNEVFQKIDDETEKKLGKYTKGMPGLF